MKINEGAPKPLAQHDTKSPQQRTAGQVRTRFAPSPTGYLHVGGVRTALFNYLYAKGHGGSFILRLEDTDRERFAPSGVEQIVEALGWLGLVPDEGFWISEGKHQNIEYVQSERHETGIYQKYANKLVSEGLAYYSPTSEAELETLREQAKSQKKPFLYRKTLDRANSNEVSNSNNVPIRLDIEAVKHKLSGRQDYSGTSLTWHDELRGDFPTALSTIEDFIIIKSDGFPTYNFANVIDDHDMKITDVMRGDEFLSSTPKHKILYEMFGWQVPRFTHLPIINGSDGKKLSKRTGDTNTLDYREKGYLPEALLNFLALLGWNDGTEKEIFSPEELIKSFRPSQINLSPAVFDYKRLNWMNGHYIRELSLDRLYKMAEGFWPSESTRSSEDYKKAVLALVQERLKYLAELPELTSFFFAEPSAAQVLKLYLEPLDKQLQKQRPDYRKFLDTVLKELKGSNFSPDDIKERLNDLLTSLDTKPAVLFPIIRIAITGSSISPEIFGTLHVLGKKESIKRLHGATKSLAKKT